MKVIKHWSLGLDSLAKWKGIWAAIDDTEQGGRVIKSVNNIIERRYLPGINMLKRTLDIGDGIV